MLGKCKFDYKKYIYVFSNRDLIKYYLSCGIRKYEKMIFRKFLRKNQEILDVCCGVGRVSIYLAKKGHKVVGIDINPKLIRIAKKLSKNIKNCKFYRADILKLNLKKLFDACIVMDMSFEYLISKKRIMAFKNIVDHTKKGGIIIFTSYSYFYPPRLFKIFFMNLKNLIRGMEMNTFIFKHLAIHFFKPWEIYFIFKKLGMELIGFYTFSEMEGKTSFIFPLKFFVKDHIWVWKKV